MAVVARWSVPLAFGSGVLGSCVFRRFGPGGFQYVFRETVARGQAYRFRFVLVCGVVGLRRPLVEEDLFFADSTYHLPFEARFYCTWCVFGRVAVFHHVMRARRGVTAPCRTVYVFGDRCVVPCFAFLCSVHAVLQDWGDTVATEVER